MCRGQVASDNLCLLELCPIRGVGMVLNSNSHLQGWKMVPGTLLFPFFVKGKRKTGGSCTAAIFPFVFGLAIVGGPIRKTSSHPPLCVGLAGEGGFINSGS